MPMVGRKVNIFAVFRNSICIVAGGIAPKRTELQLGDASAIDIVVAVDV